ncbi:unnamed protein product [Candidula unifasciata]|uniref:Kazal-like domain-containing protein n=1 Tax=Candidula unifasciata TaxID=100452 RepID=A0A8S3ZJB4_9EUPU|nr:unnamed protein product [Candidula unifasciata]
MSASIYKPVSQKVPANDKDQTSSNMGTRYEVDTRCGFWMYKPAFIQPLAKVSVFAVLYGFAGLMTQTLTFYVNSQVTTLERQFGFSSYQTGIILAANDIGYLACVLFAAYLAPRTHIPRSLGIAVIIYGISGIACSLPHFMYGASANIDPTTDHTNSTESNFRKQAAVVGSLCDIFNNSGDTCGIDAAASEKEIQISLIIIVIGMALQGFGKAPRASFSIVYVDDNTSKVNTGFYAGIMLSTSLLGPVAAFLLGGVFSRMYVTLEATQLTPRHPKWIGAWWLGYIVFGLLSLIVSIPLFCFPRKLPRKKVKDKFLSSLYRLLTNPLYVCLICSSCGNMFQAAANLAFFPKFVERMFHLPAHTANYITAGQYLCTYCVGTFIGGFLTKRFKMTAMTSIKFNIAAFSLSLLFQFLMFVFQCEQPTIHNWPGEENNCNKGCNCRDNSYFPICGDDGRTYYSPCHAGCLQAELRVYQNCSCIPRGQAREGPCDYGCSHLYGYVVIVGFQNMCSIVALMPKLIILMRCVPEKDKSMALSVSPFMTSICGWLLAPIVIGGAIDKTCLIWDITCLIRGRCLLYDNYQFGIQFHGYSALGLCSSLIFMVIAYLCARWSRCLDEGTNDPTEGITIDVKGDCTVHVSVVGGEVKSNGQELKLDEEKSHA